MKLWVIRVKAERNVINLSFEAFITVAKLNGKFVTKYF